MKFVIVLELLIIIANILTILGLSKLKSSKSNKIKYSQKLSKNKFYIEQMVVNNLSSDNNSSVYENKTEILHNVIFNTDKSNSKDYKNTTHIEQYHLKMFERFMGEKNKNKNKSMINMNTIDELRNSITGNSVFQKGNCMIKYGNYIINLYQLKRQKETFFIKYNLNIIDFNICDNVSTYEKRKGLVVDRLNNIVFAGSVENEKYWYIVEKEDENNNKNISKNSKSKGTNYKENLRFDKTAGDSTDFEESLASSASKIFK